MAKRKGNTKPRGMATNIKAYNDALAHSNTRKSSKVKSISYGSKHFKKLTYTSCQYHHPLRNNDETLEFTSINSMGNIKDIRHGTISPGKRYRSTSIHHIQRPYLDFEKMQQVSQLNVF